MALRIPPMSTLRLFEAAGRHQSFKLAAEELHLTPSAVSHGVVSLERWLAVDLFERRSNGVILTKAGKEYLSFISEALAMIAVGTRRLPSAYGVQRVSISLAPTFAARWLLPRLANFKKLHPEISLTIDTSHRQVGFPVHDVDLAVRMARAPWPELKSTLLFSEKLVPVCSPDFLNEYHLQGKLDFAAVPLLQVASVTEDWAVWLDAAGVSDIALSEGITFDTVHMATDAAISGIGVAIGRRPLIDHELVSGSLVQASTLSVEATTGYWLVQAREAGNRPEVRTFIDWIISQCALSE